MRQQKNRIDPNGGDQPEFGEIDAPAKDLHRSKRRRQPEFVESLQIKR
jgi:hypothetical protein